MIKWIVMDMDGTLLNDENRIDEQTRQILIKQEEKGVRLLLASGRNYRKLMDYAIQLKMDVYHGMLIEANGLAVYDCMTHARQKKAELNKQDIERVFKLAQTYDLELIASLDDGLYDYFSENIRQSKIAYRIENNFPEDFPLTGGHRDWISDNRGGYPNQFFAERLEAFPDACNKLCLTHFPTRISEVFEALKKALNDEYEIVRTSPRWVEISPKGISKGNALTALMSANQIKKDEVLVFGDGENDCSMFASAGIAIAMGNAMDIVKQAANGVTLDNNHNGIAYAIENLEQITSKHE
ncbi:Cof-type HAD-IIB family hydrolase [Dielma fastidiosa]|uniref:HAD family phosphatase n=1 Tax=Dielma fastidiosa TaxID=1034346 RepID=A0A318KPA8_9FIRM|nr:Cof-type HAD-IIB family hydrolase [Dielma fastidiosa]PXX77565.1 hypothetical protein DES51_110116 [Dielma fastidiosa]